MPTDSTITDLSTRKQNPHECSVKVDGRIVAVLPQSAVERMGLRVGSAWDDTLAHQVSEAAAFHKACLQAMQRLNRRAHSRHELGKALGRLGHDGELIERVLDHLAALSAFDDEQLGRALVRETLDRDPAGPTLIRARLTRRGLAADLIECLLEETQQRADPVSEACSLARQRLHRMVQLNPTTRQRRLWGLLARRGFDEQTIEAALERIGETGVEGG